MDESIDIDNLIKSFLETNQPTLELLLTDQRFNHRGTLERWLVPYQQLRLPVVIRNISDDDDQDEGTPALALPQNAEVRLRQLSLQACLRILWLRSISQDFPEEKQCQEYYERLLGEKHPTIRAKAEKHTHKKKVIARTFSKKKREQTMTPLQDIHRVLALAAFSLGQTTAFEDHLRISLPDRVVPDRFRRAIYHMFELPYGKGLVDSINSHNHRRQSIQEVPSPVVRRNKRSRPPLEENMGSRSSMSGTPGDDISHTTTMPLNGPAPFLPNHVSLVAPRHCDGINSSASTKGRNSLLLASSKRFVGSHFNTNLHNASQLFRSVAVSSQSSTKRATTQQEQRKEEQKKLTAVCPRICETPLKPRSSNRNANQNSLYHFHEKLPIKAPISSKTIVNEAMQALRKN